MSKLTPSQTIGPFFHGGAGWMVHDVATPPGWVRIAGRVLDGHDQPVVDALLEFTLDWAADADRALRFQRVYTDDAGQFGLALPATACGHTTIFARGLLRHLRTLVSLLPAHVPPGVPSSRQYTLLAQPEADHYRWDVHLGGPDETVFFELT